MNSWITKHVKPFGIEIAKCAHKSSWVSLYTTSLILNSPPILTSIKRASGGPINIRGQGLPIKSQTKYPWMMINGGGYPNNGWSQTVLMDVSKNAGTKPSIWMGFFIIKSWTIHLGVPPSMETTIFTWVWVHFDPWFLCFMSIYTWDILGLCYLTSIGYILVAETTNRFCCNTSGVHRESSNVQIFDDYGSWLKAISRMGILLNL